MALIDLDERWKFSPADVFGTVTSLGERTTGRQVRYVRRQARDLV